MLLSFENVVVDTDTTEVRRGGVVVEVEPQVFDFLRFLVENPMRLISRDEIIAEVWGGRIVSDAAIDSRVRAVRAAIGDSGQAQRLIKTVRGRGLRFVAEVTTADGAVADEAAASEPVPEVTAGPAAAAAAAAAEEAAAPSTQPSVCVLPFLALGDDGRSHALSRALPHDLVTGLARLRWLFVISRASSFQFAADHADPFAIASSLGARYCLTGIVETFGDTLTVGVELADAERGGIIWADRLNAALDEIHEVRERLVTAVVAAMEVRVPDHEAARAVLRAPERLDAWGAYHLGLRHMYRFTRDGNLEAERLFNQAIALDPNFARAHAALSFTHFQNAFGHLAPDVPAERARALEVAQRALSVDPLEPFAHYAMGRAAWLAQDLEGGRQYISRCIELNPNHAQAFYSGGLIDMLAGNTGGLAEAAETARRLSPLDPMRYGMMMLTSFALIVEGRLEEGAVWAGRSAREPNSHAIMQLLAATAYEIAGDRAQAQSFLASALKRNPRLTKADVFASLNFQDEQIRTMIESTFDRLGFR